MLDEDHPFIKTTFSTTIKDETIDPFYYDETGKESKEEKEDDDDETTTSTIESNELFSTSSSISTTTLIELLSTSSSIPTTTSLQNETPEIDYPYIHYYNYSVTLSPKEISYYQSKASKSFIFFKNPQLILRFRS